MAKKMTSVLFTNETFEKINEYASLLRRSKSEIIEEAVLKFLDDLDVSIAEIRKLTASKNDYIPHEEVKKIIKKL